MTQRYVEIPSSRKISESLSDILGNDKTALSCSSGTTFPTVNLFDGMLCYRTDELKLYQLIDLERKKQVCVGDLSGSFRHLEGGTGNAILYSKKDLNNYQDMPTGFYYGANMLNAPTQSVWRILQIRDPKDTNTENASQLAFSKDTDKIYTRRNEGGVWGEWREILTVSGRGSGNSGTSSEDIQTSVGLSADMLDGKHASNEPNCVPISNGEVNENLNADMVDGYHAGNGLGQIPVSNGKFNSQLNADMLDNYHAGNDSGCIPISNGTLCKNLNAQYIGGVSIDQLVRVSNSGSSGGSGSSSGSGSGLSPTTSFDTLTSDTINVHTLNVTSIPSTQYFTGSRQPSRSTYAPSDIYDVSTSSGSGDIPTTTSAFHTQTGAPAGNYTINGLLQQLINYSHSHSTSIHTDRRNCDCNCSSSTDGDCCDGGE